MFLFEEIVNRIPYVNKIPVDKIPFVGSIFDQAKIARSEMSYKEALRSRMHRHLTLGGSLAKLFVTFNNAIGLEKLSPMTHEKIDAYIMKLSEEQAKKIYEKGSSVPF